MASLFKKYPWIERIALYILTPLFVLLYFFRDAVTYSFLILILMAVLGGLVVLFHKIDFISLRINEVKEFCKTERTNGIFPFNRGNLKTIYLWLFLVFTYTLQLNERVMFNIGVIIGTFILIGEAYKYLMAEENIMYCFIFTDKQCVLFWELKEVIDLEIITKVENYKHYLKIYTEDDEMSIDLLKLTVEQGKEIFEKLRIFSKYYKFEIPDSFDTYYD